MQRTGRATVSPGQSADLHHIAHDPDGVLVQLSTVATDSGVQEAGG
jgi:hypothetical protein